MCVVTVHNMINTMTTSTLRRAPQLSMGIVLCGAFLVSNSASARVTATPIATQAPTSNEFADVRVKLRSNRTLQHFPMPGGLNLAACSTGDVWGGVQAKQCKKNNKKRIAEAFCRDQGASYTTWVDAPASGSMNKPAGAGAITWHVNAGQSWEQGKWIISKESPLIWKKITCKLAPKSAKQPVFLENIKYSGKPILSCNPKYNRCSKRDMTALADAICRGAGFRNGSTEIDVGEPLADKPSGGGTAFTYSTAAPHWKTAPAFGRVVRKVRCKFG